MNESVCSNESIKTLKDFAVESAKSYMRFAVYIDDKIYTKDKDESRFWNSPNELVELFAENGIALTVYECHNVWQCESAVSLIKSADITIIDWEMYVEVKNEQADDESAHTVALVNLSEKIFAELIDVRVKGEFVGPRLVCIYTKAPDKAQDALRKVQGIEKEREGIYALSEGALRFCIVNKDPGSDQIALVGDGDKTVAEMPRETTEDDTASSPMTSDEEESELFKRRKIGKEEFVPFIVEQFAQIHRGVLPTLALKVIAAVRDLMPRMMKNFSSKCDNAFIIESALQLCPESAHRQAIDAIGSYFSSALKYSDDYVSYVRELIKAWVCEHKFKDCKSVLAEHSITCDETHSDDDAAMRVQWLEGGYFSFFSQVVGLSKTKMNALTGNSQEFIRMVEGIFGAAENLDKITDICRGYSMLCHYSAAPDDIKNANAVVLSLGSVLKVGKAVYMCVQQECDSVRLSKENGRPFLFIPLVKAKNAKSEVLIEEDCYCVDSHPYNMRIWKFHPTTEYGEIRGEDKDGRIVFYGEELNKDFIKEDANKIVEFQWLFDLKDRIALKIADDMSRQFARVAIDSSEWLRLMSKDMSPIEQEPCIPLNVSVTASS